jgi:hypothetical protein
MMRERILAPLHADENSFLTINGGLQSISCLVGQESRVQKQENSSSLRVDLPDSELRSIFAIPPSSVADTENVPFSRTPGPRKQKSGGELVASWEQPPDDRWDTNNESPFNLFTDKQYNHLLKPLTQGDFFRSSDILGSVRHTFTPIYDKLSTSSLSRQLESLIEEDETTEIFQPKVSLQLLLQNAAQKGKQGWILQSSSNAGSSGEGASIGIKDGNNSSTFQRLQLPSRLGLKKGYRYSTSQVGEGDLEDSAEPEWGGALSSSSIQYSSDNSTTSSGSRRVYRCANDEFLNSTMQLARVNIDGAGISIANGAETEARTGAGAGALGTIDNQKQRKKRPSDQPIKPNQYNDNPGMQYNGQHWKAEEPIPLLKPSQERFVANNRQSKHRTDNNYTSNRSHGIACNDYNAQSSHSRQSKDERTSQSLDSLHSSWLFNGSMSTDKLPLPHQQTPSSSKSAFEFIESSQSKHAFKEFSGVFRSKWKISVQDAEEYALREAQTIHEPAKWRVYVELAELAKKMDDAEKVAHPTHSNHCTCLTH